MKKKFERCLAIVFAVLMVLSLSTAAVTAEEEEWCDHTTYGPWQNYSSTEHRQYCSTTHSCPAYKSAPHNPGSWTYQTASSHRRVCTASCGFAETASHTFTVYQPGIKKCSGCGWQTQV